MRIVIAVSLMLLVTYGSLAQVSLHTDKAAYLPGEKVKFSVSGTLPAGTHIRYRHLDSTIGDHALTAKQWEWSPPAGDFKGYLAELYIPAKNRKSFAAIGVDVSSDWSRFPRYGFLSKYPKMTDQQTAAIISKLNRFHINGLQFYDWQYKHQQPLGGTVEKPIPAWKDIGNRDNYFSTVKQFISAAHDRNIKTMSYNLIYGALDDAAKNGVRDEWYLYQDAQHRVKEKFPLPEPFTSPIYLLNPADTGWQNYMNAENRKLYAALPFDGYHVDQLGNRDKTLYTFSGDTVDLPGTFQSFIEAVKRAAPQKSVAMNSVNQYGQAGLAKSPADFLYTELWPPIVEYRDMVGVIKENDSLSNGKKKTVLAAYMNYRLADHKGYFNTPAILLTDAVIFAFGGSHLELGDHMLDKEYFPQDSLQMKKELAAPLTDYYDFMIAYENLLRGDGSLNKPDITSSDHSLSLTAWPPKLGSVAVVGKQSGPRQIIHLLNFSKATTLDWQDNKGIQAIPRTLEKIPLIMRSPVKLKHIWLASPDLDNGSPSTIVFRQQGDKVSFTVPFLKYWDMIVVE